MTDTNAQITPQYSLFPKNEQAENEQLVSPDLSQLSNSAVIVAGEVDKYLSPTARAKVYAVVGTGSLILASASTSGIAIAAVIGGVVAVKIIAISAIVGTVATAAGAVAARLARANTPVK